MIATLHGKHTPGIGKFPFLDVFDPSPIDADRQIVFLLAGDRAGVTADALAVVDDEAVIHSGNYYIIM